jgi:hypothetical protein
MTFSLDSRGNLTPYTRISVESLAEFEQAFVADFPASAIRQGIYEGLLAYLNGLGDVLQHVGYQGHWTLWIDGSFTTDKLDPNDIDVLNLFDDEAVFHQNKAFFAPFFAANAFRTYRTDAYFLLDDQSAEAIALQDYWLNQFGTDRSGFPKGIIELTISSD